MLDVDRPDNVSEAQGFNRRPLYDCWRAIHEAKWLGVIATTDQGHQ
jgi:hypothetical protein